MYEPRRDRQGELTIRRSTMLRNEKLTDFGHVPPEADSVVY
jgi:hypothetical protein